jgi:hypothetical protein
MLAQLFLSGEKHAIRRRPSMFCTPNHPDRQHPAAGSPVRSLFVFAYLPGRLSQEERADREIQQGAFHASQLQVRPFPPILAAYLWERVAPTRPFGLKASSKSRSSCSYSHSFTAFQSSPAASQHLKAMRPPVSLRRFVVDDGDYSVHLAIADKMVEWDVVREVHLTCDSSSNHWSEPPPLAHIPSQGMHAAPCSHSSVRLTNAFAPDGCTAQYA